MPGFLGPRLYHIGTDLYLGGTRLYLIGTDLCLIGTGFYLDFRDKSFCKNIQAQNFTSKIDLNISARLSQDFLSRRHLYLPRYWR